MEDEIFKKSLYYETEMGKEIIVLRDIAPFILVKVHLLQ
jgi:hypothetical protein